MMTWHILNELKSKAEHLFSALHGIQTNLKRSGMDHTAFNLQRTPCQSLPHKRSPDGASTECGGGHLIAAHYSFIVPERMKGWVGLVGWPIANGPYPQLVTRQLQVERRTAKECWRETDVLPLSHADQPVKLQSSVLPFWSCCNEQVRWLAIDTVCSTLHMIYIEFM